MKRANNTTLITAILLSASALNAYADLPQYTALDLGAGTGVGINSSGQVIYNNGSSAYITGSNGVGVTNIGTLGGTTSVATGINDSGQVVGFSNTSGDTSSVSFITGPNGIGLTPLPTVAGAEFTGARGVNVNGQVVGTSLFQNTGTYQAFITGANGAGMTSLGNLGGGSSQAAGVNASGQVVGVSNLPGSSFPVQHAFITGANGLGMTDLGTLSGPNGASSATAININGQVIGETTISGINGQGAFITGVNGVGMRDLGSLAGQSTTAQGINTSGQVVGSSIVGSIVISHQISPIWHAFITDADGTGMTDLNSLVTLDAGDYLTEAVGINDLGQIVANDNLGNVYLLTIPSVPVPATAWLFGSGVLGLAGVARRKSKAA